MYNQLYLKKKKKEGRRKEKGHIAQGREASRGVKGVNFNEQGTGSLTTLQHDGALKNNTGTGAKGKVRPTGLQRMT